MGNPYDGIILIDKNEGETSFDIVKRIRRVLKVKKVGHAGTLDPFATGLLIVLLGQGTKLSPYLQETEKVYQATMRLGIETDTQDLTGRVIQTRTVPEFDPEYIKEKVQGFMGEIEQTPPAFSAIKYKGHRAYEFARKGIKIDLQKREVKIHSIKLVSINLPDVTMEVSCSGGTYVRSLAADLGKALGTGAHLRVLRRFAIGDFNIKDALDSKHIGFDSTDLLWNGIIPLRDTLPHMREIFVDTLMAQKIRNGYQPKCLDFADGFMKIVTAEELVAIIRVSRQSPHDKGGSKVMRVFY